MKRFMNVITETVSAAFAACGYEAALGRVTVSNRPDLCEYQCNGAMAGAKQYHKAPFLIAEEVVAKLQDDPLFEEIAVVKPGFINIKVSGAALAAHLQEMGADPLYGTEKPAKSRSIVIDYGGPNVAKPLHVGHLRSAIIGESIKRICRFMGDEVVGDVHLGDWGLQMGLIIEELKERKPELPYFDAHYTDAYPEEAPFTISELEEIYPCASGKSKVDEAFAAKAHDATVKLQQGDRGYTALWHHIMNVSVTDLKKNYENLDVHFELWKKESDAQPYIPDMIDKMKADGFAHISNGALVVDVAEESDTREVPPCILLKSDGASIYATTDLATIVERKQLFDPDLILYVVDKRQEMHFLQVFRTARKTGIVSEKNDLQFLGFGTMNGRDGKPFKTREGGVMRLEKLIADITEAVYEKMAENRTMEEEEMRQTAKIIGLAALKYGDLSNQATKDYVFDLDRFISFEGNTGPYILYTIVRIKSILKKYAETGCSIADIAMQAPENPEEKDLMLRLSRFGEMMEQAYGEMAPHKICAYIYELANAFNRFYHGTRILAEEDAKKQAGYIALIDLTRKVLECSIALLGFTAPERM